MRAALTLICLCLTLGSCSRGKADDEPVSWPELVHFDELAYRADGLVRTGDLATVEASLSELLAAGRGVTPESVPSNAADPDQVVAALADLTDLVEGLASTPGGADLEPLVLGLHPVIESLMTAAGMPHIHANEGPNSGFLHPVFDAEGSQVGIAELKLHDDAGDIEVWLTRGGHGGDPWRLPVDTTLALDFPALEREVTLAVRDPERNEDESGAVTVQDGATAYFVFPGESGADASWLMGEDFAAKSELRVAGGTTGTFVLRPHVHREADGGS